MTAPPPRRRRAISETERALWRHAVREAKPLPGRALEPVPAPPPAPVAEEPTQTPAAKPTRPASAPPARPIKLPPGAHARVPGLDHRSANRLKRGQLPIEARLDLHGMTQEVAHAALDSFIANAVARELRSVLVITGKGARPGTDSWGQEPIGILRREVPRWLHEGSNRGRVLAFTEAQRQHGGGGALYVLLRRTRK